MRLNVSLKTNNTQHITVAEAFGYFVRMKMLIRSEPVWQAINDEVFVTGTFAHSL